MLYKPIDLSQPVRVQGAFLAEEEIETVVDFWKQVGAPPLPQLDIDSDDDDEGFSMPGMSEDNGDALFMQASAMAKKPEDTLNFVVATTFTHRLPTRCEADG